MPHRTGGYGAPHLEASIHAPSGVPYHSPLARSGERRGLQGLDVVVV